MDPTIQAYATAKDVTEQDDVPTSSFEKTDLPVVRVVEHEGISRFEWTMASDANLSRFYTQISNDNNYHSRERPQRYINMRKNSADEGALKRVAGHLSQAFYVYCVSMHDFDKELERAKTGDLRTSYNFDVLEAASLSGSKGGPDTAVQDVQK